MRMSIIAGAVAALFAGAAFAQDVTAGPGTDSDEDLTIPPIAEATNFVPFLLPAVLAGTAVAVAGAGGASSATATTD